LFFDGLLIEWNGRIVDRDRIVIRDLCVTLPSVLRARAMLRAPVTPSDHCLTRIRSNRQPNILINSPYN
uniref:Uncharacterized protein n=1 Tax=Plectus sambesii TaxID=2011161 RepID=A0A914UGJ9_9BILA